MIKRIPLEKIFSGKGKVRILNVLSEYEELNVTAISKKTKINHTTVQKYLMDLQKIGILHEKRFGRIRIFKINNTNDYGWKLKEFLRDWNDIQS